MPRADRTFRYVPLGAMPEDADGAPQPQAAHGVAPLLTFFGQTRWYPERQRVWANITAALGLRASRVFRVFDDADFARLVQNSSARPPSSRPPASIFLNMFKNNPEDGANPVTFRVPKLLDAGALIISLRCHPEDEAEFAGMVDFVEESDILPTFWRLAAQPPDARRELAAQRRALFRERFTPQRIFERAGIYGRLDQLL